MPIEAKTDALGVIGIFQLERSDATERAYRHDSARPTFLRRQKVRIFLLIKNGTVFTHPQM